MELFDVFIINTHQFFLSLLLSVFACFFTFIDLPLIKEQIKLKKSFLLLLMPVLAIGLFANFISAWGEEGIFFAVQFSLLIILSLISPKYAIGFLVYLLLSRPWETYDNQLMQSMPRDISYLAILSIIGHKTFKKEFFFKFNKGTFFLIAFTFWLFLSAFFSNHQSLAVSKFVEIFTKGVIIFVLIQNGISQIKDTFIVKIALILSILEKGFISFYKSYMTPKTGLEDASQRLESIGILSNSNDIAAIFILAIPLVIFFILKSKIRPFHWILAIISTGGLSYLVWQSQSRGAVLALAACFASWFFLKIKKKKYIAMIAIFSMLGGFGVISLMKRSASDLEGSTSNRLIFWKAGANMAARNPVFGVGFWGFNRNFASYAIGGDLGSEGKHMTAHSSWVLALSEGGFLGLFFFVSLWVYALYRSWLLRVTQPEYFMAVVGYGVAISFLSHTYLLFPYILLALVITHSKIENVRLDYKLSTANTL